MLYAICWFVAVISTLNILAGVMAIDKQLKPITHGRAIYIVFVNTLTILGMTYLVVMVR